MYHEHCEKHFAVIISLHLHVSLKHRLLLSVVYGLQKQKPETQRTTVKK